MTAVSRSIALLSTDLRKHPHFPTIWPYKHMRFMFCWKTSWRTIVTMISMFGGENSAPPSVTKCLWIEGSRVPLFWWSLMVIEVRVLTLYTLARNLTRKQVSGDNDPLVALSEAGVRSAGGSKMHLVDFLPWSECSLNENRDMLTGHHFPQWSIYQAGFPVYILKNLRRKV